MSDPIKVSTSLTLPCGAILPNRLCKAAMTEGLADPWGRSTDKLVTLYRRWAKSGAGLLLSGNIQVDRRSLERAGNIRIEGPQDHEQMSRLKALTAAATSGGGHFWAQLGHAGRQAAPAVCPTPVSPSAVGLESVVWKKRDLPKELNVDEIHCIIGRFASAASVCREAGFTGVQIHAAHGYLISAFLSPRANHRTDEWGGSLANRARFLLAIIRATRAAVGPDFPIGVKMNSADFQKGGFTHAESMAVVEMLNHEAIDLLELSGGTYEGAAMIGIVEADQLNREPVRAATAAREAYFAVYTADARKIARMPVMATGGFRRLASMEAALNEGTCDIVGLGRPFCVDTEIGLKLMSGAVTETPAFETVKVLNEAERVGKTADEIHAAQVFLQQSLLYLGLFDLGEGKDPDYSRSLKQTEMEFAEKEGAIEQAILPSYQDLLDQSAAVR
jgi:2,4-dienoyl-CoA reductase-like NADH-dependent reductase (Old Yellow Enzyme family)